ncbi:MAG TPA: branched-chain amino acid ABC transporter permease [Albitalea sp.]|nr:branched-chain amino acid ABC transporter permease [Albitalea sp.]
MWFDTIVSGLTAGSLYCLVAVGFNILYRPTKVFNFAQGDLVMVGAMASALLMTQLHWPWVPAFAAAAALVALLALIEERVAVAPVLRRSAGGTAWIITTLAIAMIMSNIVGKIWGADPIVVNAPAPLSNDVLPLGGISMSSYQIALILLTILLVAIVELLYGSLWGKAALAVAEDRDAALLRGIDPAAISRWSFALGGAFAALTGALASPVLSASTTLGGMLLLKGFAAAAIGGLGSNRGALIAGYMIGLTEAASALLLSPGYHNTVMLVLVLAVLLARPGGLFSSLEARTV